MKHEVANVISLLRCQYVAPRLFTRPSVRDTVMSRDMLTDAQFDIMLCKFDDELDAGASPEGALSSVFDITDTSYLNDREIFRGHGLTEEIEPQP